MKIKNEHWLFPHDEKYGRGLCCFNDDTVRAELGPRRVSLEGDAPQVVTPEEHEALKRAGKPVMVDNQARHFPRAWKIYRLVDDDTHIDGKRFVRVGTADDIDAAKALIKEMVA